MNDTGLFSGIYQGIRDHADLLDRVLVRLKAGTSSPAGRRAPAARRLACVARGGTDGGRLARMIRVLLQSQGRPSSRGGRRSASRCGWTGGPGGHRPPGGACPCAGAGTGGGPGQASGRGVMDDYFTGAVLQLLRGPAT